MTTIDDLLGFYPIVPLQIGSGILDYNGVELKSVLPPTSTLLGDYLEKISKFAAQPSISAVPLSGHYLDQIEIVDDQLKRIQEKISKWDPSKPSLYHLTLPSNPSPASLSGDSSDTASEVPALKPRAKWTIKAQLEFTDTTFDDLFKPLPVYLREHPPKELSQLFIDLVSSLRRQLAKKHSKIRLSFFRSVPRFRGLRWSRRLWFLLHGSHPPKVSPLLPA